jgi:hypothetical protein
MHLTRTRTRRIRREEGGGRRRRREEKQGDRLLTKWLLVSVV